MTELTIEESFTITCLTHTLAFGKTLGSNAVGGRPWEENSYKIGLRKTTKKTIELETHRKTILIFQNVGI